MVGREGMKKALVHGEDHMGNVSSLAASCAETAAHEMPAWPDPEVPNMAKMLQIEQDFTSSLPRSSSTKCASAA